MLRCAGAFLSGVGEEVADKKDYYEQLGVARNASDDEIKKAFRKLASVSIIPMRTDDPEDSRGEVQGDQRGVRGPVSNQENRAKYDQFGHAAFDGASGGGGGFGGGGINDIFDMFFGGGFGGEQRRQGPERG